MIGTLRARIGEAKVLAEKGNLPAADEMLESAAALAGEHSLGEVRSAATHDRSHVAILRGQYDVAVRFALRELIAQLDALLPRREREAEGRTA